MANAVTFWKGRADKFAGKTYVDGRIYFVTDDDNLGSLYLGVAGEGETVKAVMISPERLTDLSKITEGDTTSSVTAKAVVDFVKAQFADGSAYAEKIAELEASIEDLQDADTATAAILAGFGTGDGQTATVAEAIALKADAEDVYTKEEIGTMLSAALNFRGTVATRTELDAKTDAKTGDVYFVTADQSEYVFVKGTGEVADKWEKLGPVVDYSQFAQASVVTELATTVDNNKKAVDAYTVNNKAISTNPVLTGADINVSDATDAVTVKAAIEDRYTKSEIDDIVDGITGNDGSLAGKMDKVEASKEGEVLIATADGNSEVSGYTLGGAALKGTTTTGEGGATVTTYSATKLATEKAVKDSIDEAISAATLMWVED